MNSDDKKPQAQSAQDDKQKQEKNDPKKQEKQPQGNQLKFEPPKKYNREFFTLMLTGYNGHGFEEEIQKIKENQAMTIQSALDE